MKVNLSFMFSKVWRLLLVYYFLIGCGCLVGEVYFLVGFLGDLFLIGFCLDTFPFCGDCAYLLPLVFVGD